MIFAGGLGGLVIGTIGLLILGVPPLRGTLLVLVLTYDVSKNVHLHIVELIAKASVLAEHLGRGTVYFAKLICDHGIAGKQRVDCGGLLKRR